MRVLSIINTVKKIFPASPFIRFKNIIFSIRNLKLNKIGKKLTFNVLCKVGTGAETNVFEYKHYLKGFVVSRICSILNTKINSEYAFKISP